MLEARDAAARPRKVTSERREKIMLGGVKECRKECEGSEGEAEERMRMRRKEGGEEQSAALTRRRGGPERRLSGR